MIDVCFFTDEVAEDFEESVRLGTEAGATAVEIRGNLFGKSVEELEREDIKKIKKVLEKYNTEVAIIGSPVGKCSLFDSEEKKEHLEILKKMCDLAHELGTDLIRTFPFWVPDKFRDSDSRPELSSYLDEIIEGLDPMVEIAEKEKVKMCFETEGATFSGDCRELKQIIDNLDSPA
ncbi:MAG: sugar phosphate isomerase/epimerase family protein, partial [bacterium]